MAKKLHGLKRPASGTKITAVRPSAAIQSGYVRKLDRELRALNKSILWHVRAAYKANTPEIMAMDASPARELRAIMRKLARRWQGRFDQLAPKLAAYFTKAANNRVDGELERMLRKAGFTVRFNPTRMQNDVLQATLGENVALIKSVSAQYLTQVEGAVMRSVQAGRDLGTLTAELENQYGVTRRRAEFIARDQNNKATASLTRVRQTEIGVKEAQWLHSAGGRKPRPEHVAFSGKRYSVAKGAFLEGKWTWPGVEPNCRCVSLSIVPGLDDAGI